MGEFLVRQVERTSGQLVGAFTVPNFVADEALEQLYRQIFPPYGEAMTFVLGVAGPDTSGPHDRPQGSGAGKPADKNLTWSDCTDTDANEGGCYTDAMRTSFGYARRSVAFTASRVSEGGQFESDEYTFPNEHAWTPQDGADWDNPDTEDTIEQPPPEWNAWKYPEPVVGYPWQYPRKLCSDIGTPPNQRESYMGQWAPDGTLDWLCDFRKIGGFPITMALLGDGEQSKLVAAGVFRRPVLLWPGTTLYVRYRARIFSSDSLMSGAFAERFARFAFEKTGSRYIGLLTWRCRLDGVGRRNVVSVSIDGPAIYRGRHPPDQP